MLFTPVFMTDGIVDWVSCDDQVIAAGAECDYTPFKKWVWNLVGLIAITAWSGVICGLMFFTLNKLKLLR